MLMMNAKAYEKITIEKMIRLYCRKHHGGAEVCEECGALMTYCLERVDQCPLWPEKPTCSDCSIHCFSNENREAIRQVMAYSGPRMLFSSPLLTIRHLYRKLTIK